MTRTAGAHADLRPDLDEVSRQALEARSRSEPAATMAGEAGETQVSSSDAEDKRGDTDDDPEAILWAALSLAPDEGTTVSELMTATGMGRSWTYQRLRRLAGRGQVIQVSHGRWRATDDDDT